MGNAQQSLEARLARQVITGTAIGVPFVFVIVTGLCLLAKATLTDSMVISLWSTFFGAPFFGWAIVMSSVELWQGVGARPQLSDSHLRAEADPQNESTAEVNTDPTPALALPTTGGASLIR